MKHTAQTLSAQIILERKRQVASSLPPPLHPLDPRLGLVSSQDQTFHVRLVALLKNFALSLRKLRPLDSQ